MVSLSSVTEAPLLMLKFRYFPEICQQLPLLNIRGLLISRFMELNDHYITIMLWFLVCWNYGFR